MTSSTVVWTRMLALGSGLACAIATEPVRATGFAIEEQDAVTLGTAQAGRAAIAADPATVFYNPAGMTRLSGTQGALSGVYIAPTGDFDDRGSSLGGAPLSGGEGGAFASNGLIGTLHLSTGISDRVKLGLAVNAPFGLATEYDPGWVGRYHTIDAELVTININPAVAVRLSDTLSFGAGLNAQYLDSELSNAVDVGSLVGFPQAFDARATLSGDNWAFGYNLGLLYEPMEGLRFGLAYRSPVHHEVEIEADFDVPAAVSAIQATGLFTDTGGETEVTLPESVSLSAFYQATARWALLADVTWTRWSRFDELAIDFDNPVQPPLIEEQDWNDSLRISLGTTFQASENWILRAGVAFDDSPVPNELQRPRLIVGDRVLVGVGAGYRYSDALRVDIGYMHSFSEDVTVDITNPGAGRLLGDYEDLGADLFALQVSVRF